MLELRDFKRIFSIATAILTVVNIFNIKSISSIDLTVAMFLLSNMLTITGLLLQEKWQKGVVKKIRLASEYAIWLVIVVIIIDDGVGILSKHIALLNLRRLYTFVVIYTCLYCVCITAFSVTQAELDKSIRQMAEIAVKDKADSDKKKPTKKS